MIESISHIALVVKDPARTAVLFHDLFGARTVEREDEEGHREIFVRLGGIWIVLVGAPVDRTRTGDHVAFRATPEVIEATVGKLQAMGREFIRARSDRALYFFDYDDHVFELDTEDIDEQLRRTAGT
jgi:catechol 2,3-dioxygenase-like lactoylglutathione lyase family enzyme